jgi:hypothetical protein
MADRAGGPDARARVAGRRRDDAGDYPPGGGVWPARVAGGDREADGRSILAGRALVAVVPVPVPGVSKLTASVSAG